MLACVSKEEFVDFTLKIVETSLQLMRKKSIQSGKPSSQHVFIFDLEGFSLTVNIFLYISIYGFPNREDIFHDVVNITITGSDS